MGEWLGEKVKADDFNKPKEDYKMKYKVYPENDIVMQAWSMS